jgi:hypothetical protein
VVLHPSQEAVAVGYVHGRHFLELRQKRAGCCRVMPIPMQLRDDLALPSDVLRTERAMLVSEG